MKPFLWAFGLLSMLLLAGCQATAPVVKTNIDPSTLFHDDVFPDHKQIWIENETEIFGINDEARAFVDAKLHQIDNPAERIKALIGGIFDHADLNLLYENDANTVANKTFSNRAANCLSLTIMTYSMAEYANLDVRFQEVIIPEFWVRRNGYSLLNGHINLRLNARENNGIVYNRDRSFQLDFDRRSLPKRVPTKVIDKQRVMAMFYNNKGVDAMLNNKYGAAYAYFRSALESDPQFGEAWANLGLIYRWANKLEYAENTYRQALAINNDDSTTWENLAYLYSLTDRQQQSDEIIQRITLKRQSNPNYHFMLGEAEYDQKNWHAAIKHYQKAIKLDKNDHEFYFSLAKVYFELGEISHSKKYMKLAKKHAKGGEFEHRYQSKIRLLSKI